MNLTLKVPVKPHVHKFLKIKYGERYRISKRDCIGILLFQMLRRKQTDNRLNGRLEKCTHQYEVDLSAFAFFKKGCRNLDSYTVVQFNALVNDLVLAEFYAFVDNVVMLGIQQKDAIEAFMVKYEFEEADIKYDALKKSYQRYRIKEDNSGRHLVLTADVLPMLSMLKILSAKDQDKETQNISAVAA